jgi:hypothetical protein
MAVSAAVSTSTAAIGLSFGCDSRVGFLLATDHDRLAGVRCARQWRLGVRRERRHDRRQQSLLSQHFTRTWRSLVSRIMTTDVETAFSVGASSSNGCCSVTYNSEVIGASLQTTQCVLRGTNESVSQQS